MSPRSRASAPAEATGQRLPGLLPPQGAHFVRNGGGALLISQTGQGLQAVIEMLGDGAMFARLRHVQSRTQIERRRLKGGQEAEDHHGRKDKPDADPGKLSL